MQNDEIAQKNWNGYNFTLPAIILRQNVVIHLHAMVFLGKQQLHYVYINNKYFKQMAIWSMATKLFKVRLATEMERFEANPWPEQEDDKPVHSAVLRTIAYFTY